jgi:hypothetical protein
MPADGYIMAITIGPVLVNPYFPMAGMGWPYGRVPLRAYLDINLRRRRAAKRYGGDDQGRNDPFTYMLFHVSVYFVSNP